MTEHAARQAAFDDQGLRDLYCQACARYVGSYEVGRAPRRALCPVCAARRLKDYWAAGWARPAEKGKDR